MLYAIIILQDLFLSANKFFLELYVSYEFADGLTGFLAEWCLEQHEDLYELAVKYGADNG